MSIYVYICLKSRYEISKSTLITHQFHQCCVQNWWPTTASGSRAMFDFDDLETTAPWIRCGLMGSDGT